MRGRSIEARERHTAAPTAADGGVAAWPDAWLVAAVRREPPDPVALDTLVARYWRMLFGRCELLTLDRDRAGDLAQETWARVLRARCALQPDGNIPAYLVTVATNVWRDWHRSARRAGAMADHRMLSFDAVLPGDDDGGTALADALPDPSTLSQEEQTLLKLDLDRALAQLPPRSRDVLTARFLDGESAAEIGRRYGRTEQTVTAWVRQAVGEVARFLGEPPRRAAGRGVR